MFVWGIINCVLVCDHLIRVHRRGSISPLRGRLRHFFFSLLKDVPGGGACESQRAAQAAGGPVQENGGGGPRRSDSSGTLPKGRHQTSIHAVEGDPELQQHSGLQDRRHQGVQRLLYCSLSQFTVVSLSNLYTLSGNVFKRSTQIKNN